MSLLYHTLVLNMFFVSRRLGVFVEVTCETDFAARGPKFQEPAMQ